MPRGGLRPGAGRPRGSKDHAPRTRLKAPSSEAPVTPPVTNGSHHAKLKSVSRDEATKIAISYLASIAADETADPLRRDKAALGLLTLVARPKPEPPKRRERDPLDDLIFPRRR
jgi:hypothetical protein